MNPPSAFAQQSPGPREPAQWLPVAPMGVRRSRKRSGGPFSRRTGRHDRPEHPQTAQGQLFSYLPGAAPDGREGADGARHCRSDHVWMAPAGQGLCSGLAFGRSRPCIRRLICSTMAARPDEVRRRSGPNQWRALEGAPVRTGCPDCRVAVRLPSPHVAPHRLVAGGSAGCFVRSLRPGNSRPF